jgi:hypothetical protein
MRTEEMSDRADQSDGLRIAGLACLTGLAVSAAAFLLSIVVPSMPRWPMGLILLFLIAPSFIAELDLRAHPEEAKKQLWGYPRFWGTMGLEKSFRYLLYPQERHTNSSSDEGYKRHAGA